MSNLVINSDVIVELSPEEQQLLCGGRYSDCDEERSYGGRSYGKRRSGSKFYIHRPTYDIEIDRINIYR